MRNVRLTDRYVAEKIKKSSKSGSKRIYWDLQIRNFGAYKTSSGRISFLYQYTSGGRTTSRKIGEFGVMNVAAAREIAAGYARDRYNKIDPFAKLRAAEDAERSAERLKIGNYLDDYLARRIVDGDPMSAKSEHIYRRDLLGYLGEVRIDRLTTKIREDFAGKLSERGSSIVRSGLGCLKTLIKDAVERGVAQRCEAYQFKLPKIVKRKLRLGERQFARAYEAARDIDDVRADAYEMLARTAKRKEEVAELPWEELDLEKGHWKLPGARNKSGRNVLILLPRQVVELLKRLQPDPAKRRGPVFTLDGVHPIEFGSQVKDLIDANLHRRIELAAGDADTPAFPHWTIHDLRKVPSSTLREPPFRYSRDVVNAILVHKVGDDLDETYMLTELVEEAAEALQRWNDHMDALVSRPDAWPGGRNLPPMTPAEREERILKLRKGWPKRADQKRAAAAAAANPAPPRRDGRPASSGAAAVRKRRERNEKNAA